jgi:hypothetical protein
LAVNNGRSLSNVHGDLENPPQPIKEVEKKVLTGALGL